MIAVPGGEFTIGSSPKEPFHKEDEGPQKKVKISPFFMGEVEITWNQFWAFYNETMSEGRTPPEKIYANNNRPDVDAVSGDFTDWRNAVQATIRTGIVDYRDGVPVYGLAVGQQLETSVDTATGDTVIEKRHFRAIYAANRLSFWEDGVEVAYVSDHQLYIWDVVALSSLAVGRWSVTDGSAGLTFQWIGG